MTSATETLACPAAPCGHRSFWPRVIRAGGLALLFSSSACTTSPGTVTVPIDAAWMSTMANSDGAAGGYGMAAVDLFPSDERMFLLNSLEEFVKFYYQDKTKAEILITTEGDSVLLAEIDALRNEIRRDANEWEQLNLDFQLIAHWFSGQRQLTLRSSGGYSGGLGRRSPDRNLGYKPYSRSERFLLSSYSRKILTAFNEWIINKNQIPPRP